MLESINIEKYQQLVQSWILEHVVSVDTAVQSGLILIALAIGLVARKALMPRINQSIDRLGAHYRTKSVLKNISRLIMQITAITVIVLGTPIVATLGYSIDFANAVMGLFLAWVVIRLCVQFIENSVVRNMFALMIWTIAALSILGVLDQTTTTLDGIGMNIGEFRLSALSIIKGIIALFILLYAAIFCSKLLERRIENISSLTMSSRVLISKIVRVTLIVVALLIGITSAGIDLSLFAVFSGAIGLGIGFGLQKGISNLFSGMLLLMDKSIQPGDVIELPGVSGESAFGWVHHMGARYTEIITRDNKSYLVPNEDFITQQVVNWSHGSTLIRVEVKFGVSYSSDPHEIKKMVVEAVKDVPRVCNDQTPVCHLKEFGDSSLNFVCRFWIKDAEKGITNVRGDVMLAIWDVFKENNINIPFPHREVFIHEPAKPAPKKKTATKKKAS